jgi:hypothetical protein
MAAPKEAMSKPWKEYGRYGTVGIELVVSILAGYYAGHWADQRWAGGHGWVTLFGVVVGVYAGFRQLFRAGAQMQRDADREERRERAEEEEKRKLAETRLRLDSFDKPSQTAGEHDEHERDHERT